MPSLSYMQGMVQGLDRKQAIRQLQMEDRKEKDQARELQERVDRARSEAQLWGIPKEQAAAMSLGELEGVISVARERERDAAREEGRQAGDRDNRAMAAAGQQWDTLRPDVQQFFAGRAGIGDPTMARQVWETLGLGGRARALGVSHAKTLEKADDYDREQMLQLRKEIAERAKFEREEPGRKVDEENKRALTEEARARTAASAQDMEERKAQFATYMADMARGGKPEYTVTPEGKTMYRSPGSKEWKPVGMTFEEVMARASAAGAGGVVVDGAAAGAGAAGGEKAPEPVKVREVRRRTKDGKVAVFDEDSKEFLRYEE